MVKSVNYSNIQEMFTVFYSILFCIDFIDEILHEKHYWAHAKFSASMVVLIMSLGFFFVALTLYR